MGYKIDDKWVDDGYQLAPKTTRAIEFNNGVAVSATDYWIGRDADATNQLHLNVPTGATYEFSVNDVSKEIFGVNYIAYTLGTMTDGTSAIALTATMPTIITDLNSAVNFQVTSAGSSSQLNILLNGTYLAGYTGNSGTYGLLFQNQVAGTGTNFFNGLSNHGVYGNATATTAGTNIGFRGLAGSGNANYGSVAMAVTDKNSATNIGVAGFGLNTGTSPIQIGGYFGLQNSIPTYASAALMCDNGTQTSNIFVARDNGGSVFTIANGGTITHTPVTTGTLYDIQLETEWTTGTIFNADFANSTTQTGHYYGTVLDFNTNQTGVAGYGIYGHLVKTPALTQSTADTTTYTGFAVPTAGALIQNTLAGEIHWNGLSVVLPNITQTTGAIAAYGIRLIGGTITSGEENLIYGTITQPVANSEAIEITTTLGADVNGVSGFKSAVIGHVSGGTSGNLTSAFKASLTGDNNDTNHIYVGFYSDTFTSSGGTNDGIAFANGTSYDYLMLGQSGSIAFGDYAGTVQTYRLSAGAGDNLTIRAADGLQAAAEDQNGGIVTIYGGAKKASGADGYVLIGQGSFTPTLTMSDDDLALVGNFEIGGDIRFNDATGTTTIDTASSAGVARAIHFDIPVGAGGAADAALDYQFKIDGTLEAGLLSETNGSGGYQDSVWKIPYMTGDYGAAWATYTAPAPASLTNGCMVMAYNTNGAGDHRLYIYSNAGWHYVALT